MFIRALVGGLLLLSLVGCEKKPKSLEETLEDAGHEAGQALERAGEQIKDATN